MISPIQFPIWLATSQKDRSSSIDNCTINKFTHQSTSCHLCPDWWRKPLKKTEKTTLQFPTSFMLTTQPPRTLLPWRLSSVKKPWLKKITPISSSWKDSKKSSFLKDSTSREDFTIHSTWPGNSCQFIPRKACPRSHQISSRSTTRRDWMRTKTKRKSNEMIV